MGQSMPIELLATALIALAAWLLGSFVGMLAQPLWRHRIAPMLDGAVGRALPVRRMRQILRYAVGSVLLAVALILWPWSSAAHLLLAAAMAAAMALLGMHALRAASIPRWATVPLALLLFVSVLSGSAGGIAPLAQALDGIGFDLGKRRVTLLGVLYFAATAVILFALVRLANGLIGRSIGQSQGFDATQKLLFQKLAAIGVIMVAFFVGVDVLAIDLTAFAVFSGALGLAVGFGLQKTVGNLIAGIILLMDRSIKPGDVIVVGQSFGWVNKIGVRAVSVVTRDGKEHLIPNENLMTQEVENWSYSDRNVRVRIPVGISYDSDLKLAQQLMLDAALASPRVLRSPKPNVWLTGFGESRVEHDILVWISDPEGGVGNVKSDVLNRLWALFKENGIVIPFPQRDIRIRGDHPPPN